MSGVMVPIVSFIASFAALLYVGSAFPDGSDHQRLAVLAASAIFFIPMGITIISSDLKPRR